MEADLVPDMHMRLDGPAVPPTFGGDKPSSTCSDGHDQTMRVHVRGEQGPRSGRVEAGFDFGNG